MIVMTRLLAAEQASHKMGHASQSHDGTPIHGPFRLGEAGELAGPKGP